MKTKAALKKCFVHFPVEKFNKVVAPITKKKKKKDVDGARQIRDNIMSSGA